jgi:hypothetical protein
MGFDLWQALWGDPTLMSLVVARLTPATLQQLRLALLPGNTSGDASLELLRVPGLKYHPQIAAGQRGRVVELQLWEPRDLLNIPEGEEPYSGVNLCDREEEAMQWAEQFKQLRAVW